MAKDTVAAVRADLHKLQAGQDEALEDIIKRVEVLEALVGSSAVEENGEATLSKNIDKVNSRLDGLVEYLDGVRAVAEQNAALLAAIRKEAAKNGIRIAV